MKQTLESRLTLLIGRMKNEYSASNNGTYLMELFDLYGEVIHRKRSIKVYLESIAGRNRYWPAYVNTMIRDTIEALSGPALKTGRWLDICTFKSYAIETIDRELLAALPDVPTLTPLIENNTVMQVAELLLALHVLMKPVHSETDVSIRTFVKYD